VLIIGQKCHPEYIILPIRFSITSSLHVFQPCILVPRVQSAASLLNLNEWMVTKSFMKSMWWCAGHCCRSRQCWVRLCGAVEREICSAQWSTETWNAGDEKKSWLIQLWHLRTESGGAIVMRLITASRVELPIDSANISVCLAAISQRYSTQTDLSRRQQIDSPENRMNDRL